MATGNRCSRLLSTDTNGLTSMLMRLSLVVIVIIIYTVSYLVLVTEAEKEENMEWKSRVHGVTTEIEEVDKDLIRTLDATRVLMKKLKAPVKLSFFEGEILPDSGKQVVIQTLIQVQKSVHESREKQREIEQICGYSFGTFVGQDTYIMKCPLTSIDILKRNSHVKSVGQYKPKHKFLSGTIQRISLDNKYRNLRNSPLDQGVFSHSINPSLQSHKKMNIDQNINHFKSNEFNKRDQHYKRDEFNINNKKDGFNINNKKDEFNINKRIDDKEDPIRTQFAHILPDGKRLYIFHALVESSIPISVLTEDKEETVLRNSISNQVAQQLSEVLKLYNIRVLNSHGVGSKKVVLSLLSENEEDDDDDDEKRIFNAGNIISMHNDIHFVELAPVNTLHNKWARVTTQYNGRSELQGNSILTNGITGSGQVVGVGDSGLDTNSCFFYDSNHPNPPFQYNARPATSSNHRKVQGYWALIDNISEDRAHGTHVSGSVAGKSAITHETLSDHNGMAPDAKILFTDIGCSDMNGCTCSGAPCACDSYPGRKCPSSDRAVYPPDDLNQYYFPFFFESGARIQTNSWGGGSGLLGYSSSSKEIDEYTYSHKDFLVLFSAGNAGDDMGYVSLGTQAESKNALAVGASMNPLEMFKFAMQHITDFDARAKLIASLVYAALECGADPCPGTQKNESAICSFFKHNFTTGADCCSVVDFCKSETGSSQCGCALFNIGEYCCRECALKQFESAGMEQVYNRQNLAYFSSRGPTVDGRIKPDVVAPGHSIVSAMSHNTQRHPKVCQINTPAQNIKLSDHLATMGGTSMSCPITAGSAALLRQYLLDGYWFAGKKDETKGFNPSSALLKAFLISSGEPLKGYLDIYGYLIPVHGRQDSILFFNSKLLEGFGLISLPNVMQFDRTTSKSTLIARQGDFKQDPAIKTGERHKYCIRVNSDGLSQMPFKATLVWTDYPASPASQRSLINNLDLGVQDSNGDVYWGNMQGKNHLYERDVLNNVEQIENSRAPSGNYQVVVEGTDIPKGPQPYALIISGNAVFRECTREDVFITENNQKDSPSSDGSSNNMTIMIILTIIAGIAVVIFVNVLLILVALIYVIYRNERGTIAVSGFNKLNDVPLQSINRRETEGDE